LLLVFFVAAFKWGEKERRKEEVGKETAQAVLGLAPHVGSSARMAMRAEMWTTAAQTSVRLVIVDRSAAPGHAHGASSRVETPGSARRVVQDVPPALALLVILPIACLGFAPVASISVRTHPSVEKLKRAKKVAVAASVGFSLAFHPTFTWISVMFPLVVTTWATQLQCANQLMVRSRQTV